MKTEKELKEMVRLKYSELALSKNETGRSSCCTSDGNEKKIYHIMSDKYNNIDGYNAEADMGLGCGLPTRFAKIKKGDTVIDLGSGAGNDCFVAQAETGDAGRVIGIDFAEAMVEKARSNVEKSGIKNVEFRLGDIESMPVDNNTADVVVSNCVLNLVPNKKGVFSEIFRVLKPGGHFSISDIVLTGVLPEKIKSAAEMYAGCVASAIDKDEYLSFVTLSGFENMTIQKDKPIIVPDAILKKYLNEQEINTYHSTETVIRSITVYAQKPII